MRYVSNEDLSLSLYNDNNQSNNMKDNVNYNYLDNDDNGNDYYDDNDYDGILFTHRILFLRALQSLKLVKTVDL